MSEHDNKKNTDTQDDALNVSKPASNDANDNTDFSADPDWQALDAAFNASLQHDDNSGVQEASDVFEMPDANNLTEAGHYAHDEGEDLLSADLADTPDRAANNEPDAATAINSSGQEFEPEQIMAAASAGITAPLSLNKDKKDEDKPHVEALSAGGASVQSDEDTSDVNGYAAAGNIDSSALHDDDNIAEISEPSVADDTVPPPAKRGFFKRKEKEELPVFPRLNSDVAADPTFFSRLYTPLALAGIFVLTAVFLLQVLPSLQNVRLLWYSDELRQADVLRGVFDGSWLTLQLNGQLYQEAPPLYFWFLFGLHKLFALAGIDLGTDYARLMFIGTAISGLLFLWSTLLLARSTAHFDRRGSFAAGCVLLGSLFLVFLFHYSNIDLFFASFITLSHVFLYKALIRRQSALNMALAFGFSAIALFSKGALGLALPVSTAILFCIWIGKPQRLLKPDFLLGIVFALLPVVLWLGNIWATGEHETVLQMLREQVWQKAVGPSPHSEPWWYYFALLAAVWAPWTFLVLLAPWHKLFSPAVIEGIKSARHGQKQGLAFVWIVFLSGFILLSAISNKQPSYLVPLLAPLAVISGRTVLRLSPMRSMLFQRLTAFMFFAMAVAFVLLPVYYSGNIPSVFSWLRGLDLPGWEIKIGGIFFLAVILLGAICLLIGTVKSRRPESTLLILLFTATLFSFPMSTMTMPSLDDVLSSEAASVEIKRYAGMGYYPVSFGVYPGAFSYYSGLSIYETENWAELDSLVASYPKVIIAMSAKRWANWNTHPGLTEIMRFWMLSSEYVLLLHNELAESAPLEPLELWEVPEEAPVPPEDAHGAPAPALPDSEPLFDLPGQDEPDENELDGLPLEPPAGALEAPADDSMPEAPVQEETEPQLDVRHMGDESGEEGR